MFWVKKKNGIGTGRLRDVRSLRMTTIVFRRKLVKNKIALSSPERLSINGTARARGDFGYTAQREIFLFFVSISRVAAAPGRGGRLWFLRIQPRRQI